MRLDEPFPVAPDSQAVFVVNTDQIVISDEFEDEDRFIPGAILLRSGMRSSVSARFPLDAGNWGLFGICWSEPGRSSGIDHQEVELLTRIAGWAIASLRNKSNGKFRRSGTFSRSRGPARLQWPNSTPNWPVAGLQRS